MFLKLKCEWSNLIDILETLPRVVVQDPAVSRVSESPQLPVPITQGMVSAVFPKMQLLSALSKDQALHTGSASHNLAQSAIV